MWPFSNWLPPKGSDSEREPLLPRYEPDDTGVQRQQRDQLRSYFVYQALRAGYLPSTEQLIGNLRSLYLADFLNPETADLGAAGKLLVRDFRKCIEQLIELVQDKNYDNQLQQIIWLLERHGSSVGSAIGAGMNDAGRVSKGTLAISSMILTNPEMRLLVNDLATIGRLIISDGSSTVSSAASDVKDTAQSAKEDATGGKDKEDSQDNSKGKTPGALEVVDAMGRVENETAAAVDSVTTQVMGEASNIVHEEGKRALLKRIKKAVENLRDRGDYNDTVATITESIKTYGSTPDKDKGKTVSVEAGEDTILSEGDQIKLTVSKIWDFLRRFGNIHQWQLLEARLSDVEDTVKDDPRFTDFRDALGDFIHSLLTDPTFFDSIDTATADFRAKLEAIGVKKESLTAMDLCLSQAKDTLQAASNDQAVISLINSFRVLSDHFSLAYHDHASSFFTDMQQIVIPLLIRHIKAIPLKRLEISVPQVDLLLENILIVPGWSSSSFLPANCLVTVQNDLFMKKVHAKRANTRFRTTVKMTTVGLNTSAKDFGYWIQVHPTSLLPPFSDEGIASFKLDERGMDISLDLEVVHGHREQFIKLHGVRVIIHKLEYVKRGNKWAFIWWIMRPFLKHLLRRLLEKKVAEQVALMIHVLNRELLFARERLRASRILGSDDVLKMVRAVFAHMTLDPGAQDADTGHYRADVFNNRHTPGASDGVWKDETSRMLDSSPEGWQSAIFDPIAQQNERIRAQP